MPESPLRVVIAGGRIPLHRAADHAGADYAAATIEAVDSERWRSTPVPAMLSITQNTFVAYSAIVFAVLGLRARAPGVDLAVGVVLGRSGPGLTRSRE